MPLMVVDDTMIALKYSRAVAGSRVLLLSSSRLACATAVFFFEDYQKSVEIIILCCAN